MTKTFDPFAWWDEERRNHIIEIARAGRPTGTVRKTYKQECINQVRLLYWRLYGCRPNIEDLDIWEIEDILRKFTKEWNERLTNR